MLDWVTWAECEVLLKLPFCFFVAVYAYIFLRGTTVSRFKDGGGIKLNWRDQ